VGSVRQELPLGGLRVIDCSLHEAGLRASGLLAAYGADVIWVEPPGGAPYRRVNPAGASVFNRAKRSAVFDLGSAADHDRLLGLLASADVLLETWPPGDAERLGLGFHRLHPAHPGLVVGSVSGFGRDGPHRDLPASDALVHALVGTMAEQAGHREGPIFEGLPVASIGAAYLLVIGVLSALWRRTQDGSGRHVETSLLDGALAFHSMLWSESDATARALATRGVARASTEGTRLITRSFVCADGEYVGIHTGAVGGFGRLMSVLGLDDRIPASPTGRDMGAPLSAEQQRLIETELPRLMAARPRRDWVEQLAEAEVCAIEHLAPCAVFDEPQPRHNAMVVEVDDPVLGPVEQVAPPARFPALGSPVVGPAPRWGAHTDEILAEAVARPQWPAGAPTDPDPERRPLLEGVRILDLGAYFAGPYSSRLLADLGAEVIKLEPVQGDQMRGIEQCFFPAQAGKRSLALDLKDGALRPAVEGLLDWADVVHHNLRPGAAERLGLDQATVLAAHPDLVYLYAPGWGSDGPHRLRQSFAPMMSGYVGVSFEAAGRFNPPMPSPCNEDPGNGMLGAAGILMGLLHRHRRGTGVYIENPQLNAAMLHVAHIVRRPGGEVIGAGGLDPLQYGLGPFERLYQTADGWICLVAPEPSQRAALAAVLAGDVDPARLAGDDEEAIADALATAIARCSTAALLVDLRRAGVPAVEPVGPNVGPFLGDPENRRTGRVAECAHPAKGKVRELAVLLRVSAASMPPHRLAPELGADSEPILCELGYGAAEIARLRERGAVA
jgi:crotonobetainyl-CoA:carnitine CoA-transferase CaiB-like acyl-CoA transferase